MKIIDVEIPALEQVVLTTLCVPLSITKQSVFVQNHQPGTHMMNVLQLLKVRIRAFLVDLFMYHGGMVDFFVEVSDLQKIHIFLHSYEYVEFGTT